MDAVPFLAAAAWALAVRKGRREALRTEEVSEEGTRWREASREEKAVEEPEQAGDEHFL